MRKGISPVVSVVLLIAISVIAAVGLYFWVGGLATKQAGVTAPTVIGVTPVECTSNTLTVLVSNLGTNSIYKADLNVISDNATVSGSGVESIAANSQGLVNFTNGLFTDGTEYTIYGDYISQATVKCSIS